MEKYSRKNLKAIQAIVQEKTGAVIALDKKPAGYQIRQMALLAASLLCVVSLCAFACAKFSDLNGDKAGFESVYQGDGRFEIIIINDSDKELKLQDKVKVMQWSTSKEVEGDNEKIRMESSTIEPHSQGIVSIDLSEGYDIGAMEENLQDGDGYYFVLTNNNFAFGQDWMCFFDFEIERTEDVMDRLADIMEHHTEQQAEEKQYDIVELIDPNWIWPTVSQNVSGCYGKQSNGMYSDHVNIAGTAGDEIYAVADGVVMEAAFESTSGNYIVVDLGDGVMVKYGHLKKIKVSMGEEIKQGQVIATLGQTGMATGPNLLFAVSIHGEDVNPFVE
ncbi:MAG: M23 family metallopeptidase [Lachnospiraceae bacterium]|nr:M23 family metallopeptidase [Lachnospiraceae bacterium]